LASFIKERVCVGAGGWRGRKGGSVAGPSFITLAILKKRERTREREREKERKIERARERETELHDAGDFEEAEGFDGADDAELLGLDLRGGEGMCVCKRQSVRVCVRVSERERARTMRSCSDST